jgi:hypothetical protein
MAMAHKYMDDTVQRKLLKYLNSYMARAGIPCSQSRVYVPVDRFGFDLHALVEWMPGKFVVCSVTDIEPFQDSEDACAVIRATVEDFKEEIMNRQCMAICAL